jgi:hypothetical protein
MTNNGKQPVLYIGREEESQEAITILENAGFAVSIHNVPISDPIAVRYGTPVLFGLSGKFEGVEGIRIFVKNATILGYPPRQKSLSQLSTS